MPKCPTTCRRSVSTRMSTSKPRPAIFTALPSGDHAADWIIAPKRPWTSPTADRRRWRASSWVVLCFRVKVRSFMKEGVRVWSLEFGVGGCAQDSRGASDRRPCVAVSERLDWHRQTCLRASSVGVKTRGKVGAKLVFAHPFDSRTPVECWMTLGATHVFALLRYWSDLRKGEHKVRPYAATRTGNGRIPIVNRFPSGGRRPTGTWARRRR